MLISEYALNSAYAGLCLWPAHCGGHSTTTDHSKQVSEQRGAVWVTFAMFSTDHSVTYWIFYCHSHALCLFMKDRNKCQVSPSIWPSPIPGFPSSLWMHQCRLHQQKDWVWFAVFSDLPWPSCLLAWQKDSVWWCQCIFHGFPLSPSLFHLYHFTLYFLQNISWRPLCCSFLHSFPLIHPT